MPVTRERVDPVRDQSELGLVHRRWILPDDVQRPIVLPQVARLWRGLVEIGCLDEGQEARLERLRPGGAREELEMPAAASAGALLAGAGSATLVTQVVWVDDGDRRDPYAVGGESDPAGFRDYTLYAIDSPSQLLLPIPPVAHVCGACRARTTLELPRFGEGVLLDLAAPCASCASTLDLGRDKAELRNGAIFLLEELACRSALSIELPREPQSEELPDASVARLLQEAFGPTDELADDAVPPAE
ncbi:MAG: hypothetical protein ABR567_16060 [Myxococcales bacterium]|nr:hypothetical protein [Myxococcales bacterium]